MNKQQRQKWLKASYNKILDNAYLCSSCHYSSAEHEDNEYEIFVHIVCEHPSAIINESDVPYDGGDCRGYQPLKGLSPDILKMIAQAESEAWKNPREQPPYHFFDDLNVLLPQNSRSTLYKMSPESSSQPDNRY